MGSLENNDITQKLPKPSEFTNKLGTLQNQLPAILQDFQKYYVFYTKNPEYPEYQQMFQNIKGS
jgi:hypothetical protein